MSAVIDPPRHARRHPAITRIYAHAVGTAPRRSSSSRRTKPRWRAGMRALLDGGYPYLVAEIDGALAGYAYAGPYRPRPAYRFSVEDSIYVDAGRAAPRRRPRAARAR